MKFKIALNDICDYDTEDQLVFEDFVEFLNPTKFESHFSYTGNFLERSKSEAKMMKAIPRSTEVTMMTPIFLMKLSFS